MHYKWSQRWYSAFKTDDCLTAAVRQQLSKSLVRLVGGGVHPVTPPPWIRPWAY